MPKTATLTVGDTFSEKGNVHLTTEEGDYHAVMTRLEGTVWLLLHLNPDNEPACRFSVVDHSDADIAKFIMDEYDGWIICKCNVDGVIQSNSRVGSDN